MGGGWLVLWLVLWVGHPFFLLLVGFPTCFAIFFDAEIEASSCKPRVFSIGSGLRAANLVFFSNGLGGDAREKCEFL